MHKNTCEFVSLRKIEYHFDAEWIEKKRECFQHKINSVSHFDKNLF